MNAIRKNLFGIMMLAVLAVILLSVFAGRSYSGTGAQSSPAELELLLQYGDWRLVHKDNTVSPLRLPARRLPEDNTAVRILNYLPQTLESGTVLAFESTGAPVEVWLEDTVIYKNPESEGHAAVDMWNFIPLEGGLAEAQITLRFPAKGGLESRILPKIYLGPQAELLVLVGSRRTLPVQISTSVIILGLLVFLFSAVTMANSKSAGDFIVLGITIMLLGVSQLWRSPSPAQSPRAVYIQQSIAVLSAVLLPSFYFYYRKNRAPASVQKLYQKGAYLSLGAFVLLAVLYFTAGGRFPETLRIARQLFQLAAYAFCLYVMVFREKEVGRRYRILVSASLTALVISLGLETFTIVSYTGSLPVRPMIFGALGFSLLQTVAAVLFAYSYVEEQLQTTKELSESRIKLMVNQMRPHFIRSALGVIRSMVKTEPDKAHRMLYDFTNYLSFNIENMDLTENVPFREELQHIREYAAIEQERFAPRVHLEYEIEADEFPVPPLSVQPFLENAIRHGVLAKRDGGRVYVITEETEENDLIIIRDTGEGFDPDNPPPPKAGHGFSMKNAIYRIENQAGGRVDIDSAPGKGTTVTITLPRTGKGGRNENHTGGR